MVGTALMSGRTGPYESAGNPGSGGPKVGPPVASPYIEGGQQKLEDAITAYERGAALRRHCEAKLSEAEARVQAIVERADGSLTLKAAD